MKGWIATLFGGLAGRGARHEMLRQPSDAADVTKTASGAQTPHVNPVTEPVSGVPNTRIPPLPEYVPVAVLEFEGPPGAVPIMRRETVIGRHSEDDVRIRDVRISRHHARLTAEPGRFEIHNLTASRPDPNPMLVNGIHREHAEVIDGDVITLGGVSFTIRKTHGSD